MRYTKRQNIVVVVGAVKVCKLEYLQTICRAFSFAVFKAGNSIAARIAIIDITIKSSINVKILLVPIIFSPCLFYILLLICL